MGMLETKRNMMMNSVASGGGTTTEVRIVTHSTSGSDASLDITVNGVTNTYLYSQLRNRPTMLGNIIIEYSVAAWRVTTLGDTTINGTPQPIFTSYRWEFYQSADYEIIGNSGTPDNKIRIKTYSTDGSLASLIIVDSDSVTYKQYNQSQTYSKAVEVYYQSGWKVKANQDVEYNGATYHSGDMVEQWAYNQTKDIDITIL